MSNRDITLYIGDIFIAIDKIKRYTAQYNNGNELLSNELSWDGAIRELEVIGEATKRLLQKSMLSEKKYRRIVDFRNQINHGYFGIDEDIVWDVIQHKLDEYEQDLNELIISSNIDLIKIITMLKEEHTQQKYVLEFLEQLEKEYK